MWDYSDNKNINVTLLSKVNWDWNNIVSITFSSWCAICIVIKSEKNDLNFEYFFFTSENHAHPAENFQHSITPTKNKYSVPVLHFASTFAKHVSDRPGISMDRFKINLFHISLVQKQL